MGGKDIDHFLMSGSVDLSWVFGVVKLKKSATIEQLQAPMKLVKKNPILKRDWYTLGSSDLLKMIREYVLAELKSAGWPARAADPTKTLSVAFLDSRTLVFAESGAMEKFLTADTKRKEQTKYNPPNAGFPGMGMMGMPPGGMGNMGMPPGGMANMGMPQPGKGNAGMPPGGMANMGMPQPGKGNVGMPPGGMANMGMPQPGKGNVGFPPQGRGGTMANRPNPVWESMVNRSRASGSWVNPSQG